MKKSFALIAAVILSVAAAQAANILSGRIASMEGPEGYTFNKEISDHLAMDVYAPADASGGISFGVQPAEEGVTPSAMATVLANALMQGGASSQTTTADGIPVHIVTGKDGRTVLAIAGRNSDRQYAVVIFSGDAAPRASALLKTLKMK